MSERFISQPEQREKPKGYDKMPKCIYCGRAFCGMFYGGEICSPPYITNINSLSPQDIEIIKYEYGEEEIERIKKSSELVADTREFSIDRLDKTEKDIELEKKRDEAYKRLTDLSDPDRKRFGTKTGLNIDTLTSREQYYVSLLLKDEELDKTKVNKVLGYNMKIFIITEYDHSIMGELVDYLQDFDKSREINQLTKSVLESFDIFGKIISNSLNKSAELKNEKLGGLAEFSQQIYEALVRKMKDLCLIIIRARDEETQEKGKLAMKGLGKSISVISNVLASGTTYKKEVIKMPEGQMPQFLVTDFNQKQYRVKFMVRSKAEEKAQARINVEIDFNTDNPNEELQKVFYQETEWLNNPKRKGVQKESVFRMGLDLDTSNPIKPGLSLDIGRSAIESEKRIATGETLGNLLKEASPESTHTPFSFDPKFANPELFEQLAIQFKDFLKAKAA